MKLKIYNIFNSLIIALAILLSALIISKKHIERENIISAYYNAEGYFAGFVQKKSGKIRACEFSSHGTILSCSKWFEDDMLQQGKNYGIEEKEI